MSDSERLKLFVAHIVMAAIKKDDDDKRVFATEELFSFSAASRADARKLALLYCDELDEESKNSKPLPGGVLIADPAGEDVNVFFEGKVIGYFIRAFQEVENINDYEIDVTIKNKTELTYSAMIFASEHDFRAYCIDKKGPGTIKVELYINPVDYHFTA